MVKVIALWNAAKAYGCFAGFHGERLTSDKRSRLFLVKDGNAACQDGDIAAVVKIVDAERAFAGGNNGEVAAGHTEIILAERIDVERSGTLTENEARSASAVIQRKIVKLENGVGIEEGHGSIFKFHFGTAFVGGEDVTLADGEIRLGLFPNRLCIGERVAMGFTSETHIPLDHTDADDSGVTR